MVDRPKSEHLAASEALLLPKRLISLAPRFLLEGFSNQTDVQLWPVESVSLSEQLAVFLSPRVVIGLGKYWSISHLERIQSE